MIVGSMGELIKMSAAKKQAGSHLPPRINHEEKPAYAEKIEEFWQGNVLWNCPLAYFTTFKVGGPAQAVIMPAGIPELARLISGLNENKIPWRVIGRGSNILVAEAGYPGVVIILDKSFSSITELDKDDEGICVRADAGCSLAGLMKWTTGNGLAGLEFASGIPGSIGGALVMNVGAFGKEIGNITKSVMIMEADGRCRTIPKKNCRFSYRNLAVRTSEANDFFELVGVPKKISDKVIILAGVFRFTKASIEEIKSHSQDLHNRRKVSQPQGVASAGSFFRNPAQMPAGRLIEEAGLKGLRVGGAVVSRLHANFIVNAGGATADDILALMLLVQEKVWSRSGIMLEPEVDVWAVKDGKHH